jgi:acyl-CoA synthetase (AMP-forming)/AMP-acid ligase II
MPCAILKCHGTAGYNNIIELYSQNGYEKKADKEKMRMTDPLQRPADIPLARQARPGPALEDAHGTLDNAAFARATAAFAERFTALGARRGDVIAAMLPNRVALVVAMFAAWRIGAAFTPVNPALTLGEAAHQLEDSRAKFVITDANTAAVLASHPIAKLAVDGLSFDGAVLDGPAAAEAGDTALLIYTSGSTGRPKGVILDHANVAAMLAIMARTLAFTPAERALLVLPLFHVNALLVSVLAPLSTGGSSVILEKFDRHTFWHDVERFGATYFSAVPAIYTLLNQAPPEEKPDLRRLRFVICGAAPMPASAIATFETRYRVPLIEGYGLTESTVGATLNPLHGTRKPGTVGLPMHGVEIRIVDDNDRELPHGAPGEVAIRGENVMRGYLNQPEASAAALANGWLHTGDIGRFDEDGYLVLVDRKKDMIIRGGENIYPKEIENALYEHPAVAEAAVIGRPCPVMGEEVVAFVALHPGKSATTDELARFLESRLARYKRPKEFHLLPSLPKNAVGKIAKPDLRKSV